jgi:hypothetical protein
VREKYGKGKAKERKTGVYLINCQKYFTADYQKCKAECEKQKNNARNIISYILSKGKSVFFLTSKT